MPSSRPQTLADVRAALASPDKYLLAFTFAFFIMWLGSAGPLRWWASDAGIRTLWIFGVAPSFFAGSTFTCWQALATQTRPLASAAFALGITILGETAQLALPGHTPDIWDVVAGAVGASLGLPVVWWRTERTA